MKSAPFRVFGPENETGVKTFVLVLYNPVRLMRRGYARPLKLVP